MDKPDYTNYSPAEKAEYKRKQILDITKKLEDGVKNVFQSEEYQKYLQTMARFYRGYSANNLLLISMQCPDASLLAGYHTWRDKFERHVIKGAKAIRILAPAPYKEKVKQEKIGPDGATLIGSDGKPEMEIKEIQRTGFKVVNVFDVKDTEGKELPVFGPKRLTGDVEDYRLLYEAVKAASPAPISIEKTELDANGFYKPTENRIVIKGGLSQAQTLKTAIHETCHAICDQKWYPQLTRSDIEIRAESCAYVVCSHFGIETGTEYSFPYVAGWSQEKDISQLQGLLQSIQETSILIIDRMEAHINKSMETEDNAYEHTEEMAFGKEAGSVATERIGDNMAAATNGTEGIEREFHINFSR